MSVGLSPIALQIKAIRKKMVELMTRDIAGSELKEVVSKLSVIQCVLVQRE